MTANSSDPELLPKDAYLSKDFLKAEADHLWPHVWQLACREEEIPEPGDFVTYEVANESIIVVRTPDRVVKAWHNVCPHRGRKLTQGVGHVNGFVCRYHGWRWGLEGENQVVVDHSDWKSLDCETLHLKPTLVDTWGGFVFINMDLNAGPLADYLFPVNALCEKFEFEKLRFQWYRTTIFPANWKVVLEGFNEAYHVQQTHRQMLDFMQDYTNSAAYGKHGAFWYPPVEGSRFARSFRLPPIQEKPDHRTFVLAYYKEMHEQLNATVSPRSYRAVQQLDTDLDEDASPQDVLLKIRDLVRNAAVEEGAGWPDELTADIIREARNDWHVFPNFIFLHSGIDNMLAYRARPNGDDPDSCIFDIWSLVRYGEGQAPPLNREFYTDFKDCDWGRILSQDFQNLPEVQAGMKSSAFEGSRLNPVQEVAILNFHRVLREYVEGGANVGNENAGTDRKVVATTS